METLTEGCTAPDFTLQDQQGNSVTLSSLQGNKVLIYFYPKAMTPGCTVQAQQLRESQPTLKEHNVITIGISTDPVNRLAKFEQRDNLNFTLLADEQHLVAESYGVWGLKKFMGKQYDGIHRISFLIDENGKIEKVFTKFKTKDHHQLVIDYLQSQK